MQVWWWEARSGWGRKRLTSRRGGPEWRRFVQSMTPKIVGGQRSRDPTSGLTWSMGSHSVLMLRYVHLQKEDFLRKIQNQNVASHWQFTLFIVKAGSSSWKRNLLMLSNLSPELKIELDEQKTISGGLKKYLWLEEQVSHLTTLYRDLHTKHSTLLFTGKTRIQCGWLFKETWPLKICLC